MGNCGLGSVLEGFYLGGGEISRGSGVRWGKGITVFGRVMGKGW